jgi:anti-anti-sigma factor
MRLVLSSEDNNLVQIVCEGEICQTRFPQGISDPLEALLGPTCHGKRVVMDLGQANFIDSSGISWLMSCHKKCAAAGGQFVLHSVPPMIEQVLRLLHLHNLFTIKADREAALAVVSNPRGMA